MTKPLLIATRNEKKQQELQTLIQPLGWRVLTLRDFPDCPDVEEDGLTFEANAGKKAVAASLYSGLLTLADDSGLEVDAMNGRPGVYSARYARGEGSTDEENLLKVLEEMQGVPENRRTARFVCAAAVALKEDILFSTRGTVEGILTTAPRGEGGFGYDPIFYYPPFGKTLAEVPSSDKHTVSHRGKALAQVIEFLRERCNP